MDDAFKFIFDRDLSDERSRKEKKSKEFRAPHGINPDDANYDPAVRLKRRLKLLFPHLPATPGIPPRTVGSDEDW